MFGEAMIREASTVQLEVTPHCEAACGNGAPREIRCDLAVDPGVEWVADTLEEVIRPLILSIELFPPDAMYASNSCDRGLQYPRDSMGSE